MVDGNPEHEEKRNKSRGREGEEIGDAEGVEESTKGGCFP